MTRVIVRPRNPAARPGALVATARTLAASLLLAACAPSAPPPEGGASVPPRVAAVSTGAPRSLPESGPAAALGEGFRHVLPPPQRLALDQVAALDPGHAVAAGSGRLYRLEAGRWAEIPVASAEVRAVAAGASALWALGKGTGAQAGRAIVLRVGETGVSAVARPDLGLASEPRALLVIGPDELMLGGEAPALARVALARGEHATPIDTGDPRVTALEALAGGAVAAWHGPRRLSLVRGVAAEPPRQLPADVRAIVVAAGEAFTVRGRGVFAPGLLGATGAPMTSEPPFEPALFGLGADRSPVVAGARRYAVWRLDRHDLAHTNEPDGTRRYFQDPLAPGWQSIDGALPRDPIAVLPTAPPMVAGRDGALSTIERGGMSDVARPVVEVPYPAALAVVPLRSGAALLVTARSITRVDAAGPHPVALDARARRWLEQAVRPGARASWPLHAAAFRDNAAVLGSAAAPEVLWMDDLTARVVALPAEPLGVTAAPGGTWLALLHTGRAVVGGAGAPRPAGNLAALWPDDVSHCIGAFTGQDGRPRLVARDRPIVCVEPSGVSPCGPVVSVNPRRVWGLSGGLLVQTQRIDTHVIDERGARRVPELRGGTLIAFAGPVSAPHALRDAGMLDGRGVHAFEVDRLDPGGWTRIAGVPAPCVPEALAIGGGGDILVGCEGESLIAR